jgi:Predicted nucleic acid-binding protein, contains PIN domain
VIVPDVNLLIYAYCSGASHHEAARRWWEESLNGDEPVGIPWLVIYGFVRLMTNHRVLESPIAMSEALDIAGSWLERPRVLALAPGARHMALLSSLLASSGGGSNLTTDAAIAAIAIERKAKVCSNDVDFLRFPGLQVENPIKD